MQEFLHKKDMATYFSGVVDVEWSDDEKGVYLNRFSARQLDVIRKYGEPRLLRARCSAGIQLALRTDSPSIDLDIEVRDTCRPWLGIDVEVNQQLIAMFCWEEQGIRERKIHIRLDRIPANNEKKLRDVVIHFPHTAHILLKSVRLQEQSVITKPIPAKNHLLFLGDSITQGMDARHPVQTYPSALARILGAELINQGIGGHVFDPEILSPPAHFEPDAIVLAYGTNDWNQKRDKEDTGKVLKTCVNKLHDIFPGTPVFLVLPIWRANHDQPPSGQSSLHEFSCHLAHSAQNTENTYIVPGFQMVPQLREYMPDGLHPNDAGFLHYAINLARWMLPHLPPSWFIGRKQRDPAGITGS